MAIIQALIAALTRSAGKLLNTAFGWATGMLFGRVAQDRQIYLSVISFGSVIWIIALVGVAFPSFATFLFSFVTLPDWIDKKWVRLAMLVAVAVIPGILGLVSLKMLEPAQRPKGARATVVTVLKGYPYTLGLALTLVMMTIFAPIMKVRNLARRWTSEHVPVVIEAADYPAVVADVQNALRAGGVATERTRASIMLRLPTKILTLLAGGAVTTMVADELTVLKSKTIEVLTHPSDLVISGRELEAAHARAVLAERLTFTDAHLTWDKEANEIEDRLRAIWRAQRVGADALREGLQRLAAVEGDLRKHPFPYEEWEVLYRETLVVERRLLHELAGITDDAGGARPGIVDALVAHSRRIGDTLDSLRDAAEELRRALRRAA
jgi:hypothetical protein